MSLFKAGGFTLLFVVVALFGGVSIANAGTQLGSPVPVDANGDGMAAPEEGVITTTASSVKKMGGGSGSTAAQASIARSLGCKWYKRVVSKKYSNKLVAVERIYWRIDLIEKWCGHWIPSRNTGVVRYTSPMTSVRVATNWHNTKLVRRTTKMPGRPDLRNTKVEAVFEGGLTVAGVGITETMSVTFGLIVKANGQSQAWQL